jgi:hypothetical protein
MEDHDIMTNEAMPRGEGGGADMNARSAASAAAVADAAAELLRPPPHVIWYEIE